MGMLWIKRLLFRGFLGTSRRGRKAFEVDLSGPSFQGLGQGRDRHLSKGEPNWGRQGNHHAPEGVLDVFNEIEVG